MATFASTAHPVKRIQVQNTVSTIGTGREALLLLGKEEMCPATIWDPTNQSILA